MKAHRPYLIVLVLLAAAVAALAFSVDVKSVAERIGVNMTLPERVGDWKGDALRYCHNDACGREWHQSELPPAATECTSCKTPLFPMSLQEFKALPEDTEFVKSIYADDAEHEVFVSIVLSGREGSASIHRPQRCLTGQGFNTVKQRQMDIPLGDGKSIGVQVIDTVRSLKTENGVVAQNGYYAYWYCGPDRETPSTLIRMFWMAWDRIFHRTTARWAYIAVAGHRDPENNSHEEELKSFVRLLHKDIVL